MATFKLYLDTRGLAPFDEAPVKIRISQGGAAAMFGTGISVDRDLWDSGKGEVVGGPMEKTYNSHLKAMKAKVETAMLDLRLQGRLAGMTAVEIRNHVVAVINKADPAKKPLLFTEALSRARDAQSSENSRNIYDLAIKYLHGYDSALDGRSIEEVDLKYIQGFDKYLAPRNARNSRNIYHRAIRAAFNLAIDDELTANYPYRRFKIRNETTRDKALSVEDMRRIFAMETGDFRQEYLDMFKLMFLLIGINMGDLAGLRAVQSGRIEYKRSKTSKHYSVKVLPEAQALIDKYRGVDHLLLILEKYSDYKDYMHHLNDALKTLGMTFTRGKRYEGEALWPELSTGWARTTWATIATELDIPRETISAALGHSVVDVTSTYIRLDMRKKVDAANKAVAEWVIYSRRPE